MAPESLIPLMMMAECQRGPQVAIVDGDRFNGCGSVGSYILWVVIGGDFVGLILQCTLQFKVL